MHRLIKLYWVFPKVTAHDKVIKTARNQQNQYTVQTAHSWTITRVPAAVQTPPDSETMCVILSPWLPSPWAELHHKLSTQRWETVSSTDSFSMRLQLSWSTWTPGGGSFVMACSSFCSRFWMHNTRNRVSPGRHSRLTPSLPQTVTFPGWKMHRHAWKQYIFQNPITRTCLQTV